MKKLSILLLLCLGIVSLVPACTSNGRESNPQEVVNGFLEAFMADDLEKAMTYFADDAVFNSVNADQEYVGQERVSRYVRFIMRDVIEMETRNFSVDGSQVTWEAALERTSSPTEISYSATIEDGKISYLETHLILDDD